LVAEQVTCGEFDNVVCSIAVYEKDDHYDWHLDRLTSGSGKTVKVAYTIFLNDAAEYCGGDLHVKHEFGQSTFCEDAGTAVFYPAGYLHKVDEVTSGKRIVIVGLMDCLVASYQDRYTLIQLNECLKDVHDISEVLREDHLPRHHARSGWRGDTLEKMVDDLDSLYDKLAFVEKRVVKKCVEG
jgi:hypothetical protein